MRLGKKQNASAELIEHVRSVAERTMADARAALAAAPFQSLLLDPARALRKRRRTIRRMGGDAEAMTVEQRHRLRIAVKKMRYAADYFAALYTTPDADKAQQRFGKLAAKVQDHLGDLHDLDVIAVDREALLAGLEPIGAARLSAELDLAVPLGGYNKLLARSGRALARLDQASAWWKDDL